MYIYVYCISRTFNSQKYYVLSKVRTTASTFKFQFSAKNITRFLLKFTDRLCTINWFLEEAWYQNWD